MIYDVLETKMLSGGSDYDVVVPSGTFLQLDQDQLSNAGNLWDVIKARTVQYDPENAYSINYMWGTTGFGVNTAKVAEVLGEDAPIDSLALVFDPANMEKLAECGVQFLDAPSEMIPAALQYIGQNPDRQDPDVIALAEPVRTAVRPYIQKFHSSEYIKALANGDICVAFGWSGDILQARDRAWEADNGVEIAYNAPTEGALMWFDQMAIPVDAPNVEAAHTSPNFILDANNMAAASNYLADFIGDVNLIDGIVDPLETEGTKDAVSIRWSSTEPTIKATCDLALSVAAIVDFAIRPEKVLISADKPDAANLVKGKILDIAYLGNISTYHVEIAQGVIFRAQATNNRRLSRRTFTWEDQVYLSWTDTAGVVLTK